MSKIKSAAFIQYFTLIGYQIAFLLFFVCLSIKTATSQNEPYSFVNIFREPNRWQRVMYITACWLFLFLSSVAAQSTTNVQMDAFIAKLSFVVYCCHNLFIQSVCYVLLHVMDNYGDRAHKPKATAWELVVIYLETLALSYSFSFVLLRLKSTKKQKTDF